MSVPERLHMPIGQASNASNRILRAGRNFNLE